MTDPAKCSNITEYSRDKAPVLSLVKWRTHGVICVVEQSRYAGNPEYPPVRERLRENLRGADNQQGRLNRTIENPQRLHALLLKGMMI